MAVQTQVQNISIEPMDPRWGNEEIWCIDAVDDVAASLAGKYFTGEAIGLDGVVEPYYVWLDDSSATDPAPAGKTAIAASLTAGDDAATVAASIVTAVAASSVEINASDLGSGKFLIQNKFMGAVTPSADVDTLFTFTIQYEGSRLDLGFTEDIELSMSELLVDVTASQLGAEAVTRLRNGNEVGPISIPMKEGQAAKIKELIEVGGSSYTPAGGTAVSGWGRAKNFTNVISDTKKLVLHPTRKDISDQSEDYSLWRAYPNLSSLTFSGESEKIVTVEFTIYNDELRVDEVSKYVFGDSSQNYLK